MHYRLVRGWQQIIAQNPSSNIKHDQQSKETFWRPIYCERGGGGSFLGVNIDIKDNIIQGCMVKQL